MGGCIKLPKKKLFNRSLIQSRPFLLQSSGAFIRTLILFCSHWKSHWLSILTQLLTQHKNGICQTSARAQSIFYYKIITQFFIESMGQVWVLSSFLNLFLFVLKYVLVPVILFLLHVFCLFHPKVYLSFPKLESRSKQMLKVDKWFCKFC